MGEDGVTPEGWRQLSKRLVEQGLRNQDIAAEKRVLIGKSLAGMGDPRPEVIDVDAIQFCFVPDGPFFLGSTEADAMAEENERQGAGIHNLNYDYLMARYPVTVAQYRQFVTEAGDETQDSDCLRGPDNTPVVWVTWHDANAFCVWLTTRWQQQGLLPKGWRVALPSEPEWEKAARGGERIPAAKLCNIQPGDIIASLSDVPELIENKPSQRIYPWGNDADDECANYSWNICNVSAVGCYLTGASLYGCEEMSGNVLEWTRSLFQEYPYPEDLKGRQVREDREQSGTRVLRGGSFIDDRRDARCAYRISNDPDVSNDDVGFRVVLSPLTLTDEISER